MSVDASVTEEILETMVFKCFLTVNRIRNFTIKKRKEQNPQNFRNVLIPALFFCRVFMLLRHLSLSMVANAAHL